LRDTDLPKPHSVVSIAPGNRNRRAGSVGTLLSCVEAEIRNDEGEVLRPVRRDTSDKGGQCAKCYYRNPELTSQRFVDGWFDTCDIAKFDDDGYLSS
jgi:long-chain acyl-CoA synthetase